MRFLQVRQASALIFFLILFFGAESCEKRTEKKLAGTTWISFERTVAYEAETITYDEDQFNHILHFNAEGSFYRTYEHGIWKVENNNLVVTTQDGHCTISYKLVKHTNKELILESRRSPIIPFLGCADGNENDPKVTEVYKRSK